MVGGVPRDRMFWRVHDYNLKKKTYSRLALGRTDNYDLKKKGTVVWRVHNYVRKTKVSVVWPSVGMFGGVPQARMLRRVHNYDLEKKTYSCLAVGRTDSIMVLA
jgi:hypothetical protein